MLLTEVEMLNFKARERHHLLRHGFSRVQTTEMVLSVRVAGKKAGWP